MNIVRAFDQCKHKRNQASTEINEMAAELALKGDAASKELAEKLVLIGDKVNKILDPMMD